MVNAPRQETGKSLSFTQFVLLLHSVPHLGEKALTRLLHHNAVQRIAPEACLALTSEQWQARYELDPRAADYLCDQSDALLARSEELARLVRAHRLSVLTTESLTYPTRLQRYDDAPPPILYALGRLALLEPAPQDDPAVGSSGRFTFSIAVSNGASGATLAQQDVLANALIQAGGIPVTGHDRTAYKRLALCAQRQNQPAIYVLDRGMREALGPELDRPLFAAARIRETVFDTTRDLVLSPFRLDDHAIGANNRRRDRMIYALADLAIALDVRAGGGMAGECLRAHQQRRPVFVAAGGRDGNAELLAAGCPPLPIGDDWTEQAVQSVVT